jgi:hypothetical protein
MTAFKGYQKAAYREANTSQTKYGSIILIKIIQSYGRSVAWDRKGD